MPAPTTAVELIDLVQKSGVVDSARLDTYIDEQRSRGSLPAEPKLLAAHLIRDGLLTVFQAEQILQGKWKRFTIGKYKVLERLGSGGMGQVYLCEHLTMRNRFAVKILPTAKAKDESSLKRFQRKARAAGRLHHPNLVRAFDIDQQESGTDTLHYLVMEYVDGASLQEIVKRTGPLDPIRACHYVYHAAQGLQYAYEDAELVHRDIKPGNIMVDRQGAVKVLDMGLARFFNDNTDNITRKYEESVLGTADYLSPEQVTDSHEVDVRADIYSLGATFYFLLTGKPPFPDGTIAQKLIWHQTRQPKPVRLLRPAVPEGVAAIIERMMMKDPAARYQTPAELAGALAPYVQTPIAAPVEVEIPRMSPAASGGPSPERVATPTTSPTPGGRWAVPTGRLGGTAVATAQAAAPPAVAAPGRLAPVTLKATETPRPQATTTPAPAAAQRREERNPFAHLMGGGKSPAHSQARAGEAIARAAAMTPGLRPTTSTPSKLGAGLRIIALTVALLALGGGAFIAWRLMLGMPAGWW